ncbi:MAG: sugar phosphate isomerase/epimerase family protein [Chloroflexota bacterium]
MKNQTMSRRRFLGTTAAAAAVAAVPFNSFAIRSDMKKPNSRVGGVQLGLTTYCYRSIPHSLEETLSYVLQSNVNSLEMRSVLEEGLGIPQARGGAGRPGANMSEQEKADRAKAAQSLREEQKKWRLSLPISKYADIRKMYNKAGVDIHIAKFVPSSWSDEEIDYAYNAAKALGAYGITDEFTDEAAQRLGKFAEKHNSLAIYHTHGQFGMPGFDIDKYLGYNKTNRLNLDIGHYYGSTGKHPNEVIEKYHTVIPSIHVKDKTGPKNAKPNENRPFGEGETPIKDVLLLIKKMKWPINVDLELEYNIPEGSDPVKEVTKCIEYMRNILE